MTTKLVDDFPASSSESQSDQRRHLNSDKTLVKINPLPGSLNASQSLPRYTPRILETIVDVVRNGRTDAARVSAANVLLD